MALFMTLLVRDEEDIIDANIRYHLDQGVDHVIVTDNLSCDGTPDILQTYVRDGVATIIQETEDTQAQGVWVTRMVKRAYDAGARWIINNDADEFWFAPEGHRLKTWLSRQIAFNCCQAARHDFVCLEDDGTPFWQRMTWRKTRSTNALGRPLPPKVAHRARKGLVVGQGNHKVDGFVWKRIRKDGLEVLHFPIRSRAQYIQKTEAGGRAYANNTTLPKHTGIARRTQWEELQRTGTTAFLEDNIVAPTRLEALIASGDVVEDRRLVDALTKLL